MQRPKSVRQRRRHINNIRDRERERKEREKEPRRRGEGDIESSRWLKRERASPNSTSGCYRFVDRPSAAVVRKCAPREYSKCRYPRECFFCIKFPCFFQFFPPLARSLDSESCSPNSEVRIYFLLQNQRCTDVRALTYQFFWKYPRWEWKELVILLARALIVFGSIYIRIIRPIYLWRRGPFKKAWHWSSSWKRLSIRRFGSVCVCDATLIFNFFFLKGTDARNEALYNNAELFIFNPAACDDRGDLG